MKRFKFRKEEYVVLKKDVLEDALHTAVVLTSMQEQNTRMLAMGYGDPNFDVSNVTVGDAMNAVKTLAVPVHIVDRILENL
jgi:hypothetical protein